MFIDDVQDTASVLSFGRSIYIWLVAANFKNVNHDDLVAIPDHKIVCDLLDDDELNVRSEDQVFDAIYNYCQTKDGLTTRMKEEIWFLWTDNLHM